MEDQVQGRGPFYCKLDKIGTLSETVSPTAFCATSVPVLEFLGM